MYNSSRGILYTAPPKPDDETENRADERATNTTVATDATGAADETTLEEAATPAAESTESPESLPADD